MPEAHAAAERTPRRRPLRRSVLALLVLAVIAYGVRVALWRPLALVGDAPGDGYTRVAGAIHMHTTFSDGGGSPAELIQAARTEGLDFIVITDHNSLAAKPIEGYHGGVLVMVGSEISTRQGHLVGVGMRAPSYCFSGDARDALDDVRDLGGFPIAAHPLRASMVEKDEDAWSAWDLPGPWGVELINGMSQWVDAGWGRRLRMLATYPLNPRYALLSLATSPRTVLARWDALLAQRDVTGVAGADAHSRVHLSKRRGIRFPAYGPLIGLMRNHLLLDRPLSGDALQDATTVRDALAQGRLYVATDGLAPADDFSFTAEAGARRVTMGETVAPDPVPTLRVAGRLPRGARVRLLRDGQVLREGGAPLAAAAPGTGVYRVEVGVPGWEVPWVLSNPIYVMSEEGARTRAARGAWPEPAAPPAVSALLDGFGPSSSFQAEFDASSAMETPPIDGTGGVDGGPAAKLAFRLGAPTDRQPYTWCALVSREARDLSGSAGLTFWIRADGVYRLWVQVRDANPASGDEGTEWWFGSVRTSPQWRRVQVPYERLFSLNAHSDGRVDLDRVRGLVFVLDHKAVPPGTQGTIWIDELGLYR